MSTSAGEIKGEVRGYVEGYYGKLLSWTERSDLVKFLASLQLNTYCYAPKEDTHHRLHWREPYGSNWHQSFSQFCTLARDHNVSIVAGIAPGLDFNHKDSTSDFNHLNSKASKLLNDGADKILVLWDDIEATSTDDLGNLSEGAAHAQIVNQLAVKLKRPVWTVPRVYAAEIENNNCYLEDFFTTLDPQHTVLLCGNAIVASSISQTDLYRLSRSNIGTDKLKHRTVVWDNFYANDYCPRRLFMGPWTGREAIDEYLINPTGMPYTDQLLLDIASSTHTSQDTCKEWADALKRHGVPDAFQSIAPYFSKPFFGDRIIVGDEQDFDTTNPTIANPTITIERAIEECLWKWKSPLAREWYPFIFGLKHDLALHQGTLPRDRILKTQTTNLAGTLINNSTS